MLKLYFWIQGVFAHVPCNTDNKIPEPSVNFIISCVILGEFELYIWLASSALEIILALMIFKTYPVPLMFSKTVSVYSLLF